MKTMEVYALNGITHNHSIVVLKDTFHEFANRFLVYEDTRWACLFFPNYKENVNNEAFIREHISAELKIHPEDLSLEYTDTVVSSKFSESAKEHRIYSHRFYLAMVAQYPEVMQADTFEIDGRRYHWKTITELESDENVKQKNLDIVNVVKRLF